MQRRLQILYASFKLLYKGEVAQASMVAGETCHSSYDGAAPLRYPYTVQVLLHFYYHRTDRWR